MTTRRGFLAMASLSGPMSVSMISFAEPAATTETNRRTLEIDGVRVSWRHAPDHFTARLVTPSPGWLAFGVNDRPSLAGTRFVIADVSASDIRASERIALASRHVSVDSLNLAPALLGVDGARHRGKSSLEIRLKRSIDARPRLRLRSGSRAHLMLAWSRETDFAHHSAWRRHVPVEL